ncbi:MAG: cellulase family glycosylhydrolase [Oscillospiraceae bacterium]
MNSEFVKLIRSLGGRNADRFLLIAGYNTDITKTCDDRFQMPEDTADSKLLLSRHYYTPWDYCAPMS